VEVGRGGDGAKGGVDWGVGDVGRFVRWVEEMLLVRSDAVFCLTED